MKSVKVNVAAVRDGDVVSGVYMKQRKKGDAWVNEEAITVVSGQPDSERIFVLDNDQRLVVEAKSDKKVVFDKAQSAAVTVQDEDPLPTPSPGDTDGDESPTKPAVERAQEPRALSEAAAQ